jgi:hypothetical protein
LGESVLDGRKSGGATPNLPNRGWNSLCGSTLQPNPAAASLLVPRRDKSAGRGLPDPGVGCQPLAHAREIRERGGEVVGMLTVRSGNADCTAETNELDCA